MRRLTLIGICLLIVTLALGADAARERGSRGGDSSSARAEERSAPDRRSGPADRPSESYRPGSSYQPSAPIITRGDSGPSASVGSGGHGYVPSYRPGPSIQPAPERRIELPGRSESSPNYPLYRTNTPAAGGAPQSSERHIGPADSGYRPGGQNVVENRVETPTRSGGAADVYSTYRPDRGERTIKPVTVRERGNENIYTTYRDGSATDTRAGETTRNSSERTIHPVTSTGYNPRNGGIYATYREARPDVTPKAETRPADTPVLNAGRGYQPSHGDSARSDNHGSDQGKGQENSGYRHSGGSQTQAVENPTTRSIRDRKLAEARMAAAREYRPSASKPHFTYSHYTPPKGYKPPSYREGHYYYSHPHYARPCNFGFWSFDYYSGFSRRSLYFHYGFFPYIEVTRIIVESYPTVVYVDQPIYSIYGVRYDARRYPGLDDALADIRSAWTCGRFDLIERHVSSNDIAVLLDGKYDYSVTAEDYLSMTQDALGEMNTLSFVWDKVQQRRDGTITGFATHKYQSADTARKVYVSYTLKRMDGRYYITEVGSTQTPWN